MTRAQAVDHAVRKAFLTHYPRKSRKIPIGPLMRSLDEGKLPPGLLGAVYKQWDKLMLRVVHPEDHAQATCIALD